MALFGKIFKITLISLIIAELFSFLGYLIPIIGQVAFFVILGLTLILALIKLEYGLYILLAELFVGSKGYLFALDINGVTISIRIGLFLIILAVWLWRRIKQKDFNLIKNNLIYYYLILFTFVLIGLISGIKNNGFGQAFFDFNAWLYFALIFVFLDVIKEKKIIGNILQVLVAATSWLAIKTIVTLFLFSHNLVKIGDLFYNWIRETGVGEVTYISGTLFRVFFQSQLYCLIGFLIVLSLIAAGAVAPLRLRGNKKQYIFLGIYLYLVSLAVIISQSRSFWVGGMAALITLIAFVWWKLNFRIKKTALLIFVLAVVFSSQLSLVQLITNNFSGNLITDRFKNLEKEAAGLSRLNQLQPLTYNIFQQLIFGYGFGKELTYQSNDPRILKTYPGGIYATYAFEWGYLDIALKLGLLGLLAYLFLITKIFYQGFKEMQNAKIKMQNDNEKFKIIISLGFISGLVALCATNIFSPYLNHPLGIGYIMLVSAIVSMASQTKIKKDAVKT